MNTSISKSKINRGTIRFIAVTLILAVIMISTGIVYAAETQETERGQVDYQLSYRFYLVNEGPVDLTSVTLRLALLKDWDPVQIVTDFVADTLPNQTTTDEYDNEFVWYEFSNFRVNQSIDLWFHANITLNFVDYTTANLPIEPYDTESDFYKLMTAYHPLADSTDPNIRNVAQSLEVSGDPLQTGFNLYNFTANYIDYRLLSSIQGASYALRNGAGDCDEYTTLFVALSRALGIPAISHTAWLADFTPGFVSTDEGAIAHAYPMFYVEGVGMLPADATRGKTSLYDNWLKTDAKRITMTRGPDNSYRLLRYRWIPVEGMADPTVFSNYSISIEEMNVQYTSNLRNIIILALVGIPVVFALVNIQNGYKIKKYREAKLEKLLSPQ